MNNQQQYYYDNQDYQDWQQPYYANQVNRLGYYQDSTIADPIPASSACGSRFQSTFAVFLLFAASLVGTYFMYLRTLEMNRSAGNEGQRTMTSKVFQTLDSVWHG